MSIQIAKSWMADLYYMILYAIAEAKNVGLQRNMGLERIVVGGPAMYQNHKL